MWQSSKPVANCGRSIFAINFNSLSAKLDNRRIYLMESSDGIPKLVAHTRRALCRFVSANGPSGYEPDELGDKLFIFLYNFGFFRRTR